MKTFERIFLYSLLAILFFYVFLVDRNVESKVVIQEEIRAKSISIMNNAGQEVVNLCTIEDGGAIFVANKAGTPVAYMSANKYDGGEMGIANKAGTFVAFMGAPEDDGIIGVLNKYGKVIDTLP